MFIVERNTEEDARDPLHCQQCGAEIKLGETYLFHANSHSSYCKKMGCGMRRLFYEEKQIRDFLKLLNPEALKAFYENNSVSTRKMMIGSDY